MKNFIYLLSFLIFTSCYYKEEHEERIFSTSKTVSIKGDNPIYATKNFDDTNWNTKKIEGNGDEIFWSRKKIEITQQIQNHKVTGILVFAFGAYTIYWDGVLIGKNGNPGFESSAKKTGSFMETYVIPTHLLEKGQHSLALKRSKIFGKDDERDVDIYIGDYKRLVKQPLLNAVLINILTGAFLVTAIYYFLLYINDRKKYELLLFSIASLLFFLLSIMEYLKFYMPIHYSHFYLRLQVIGVLVLLISFLVPYYFSIQFPFKKRNLFMWIYIVLLLGVFIYFTGEYDLTALLLGQMMWFSSTIIIIYAIYKKQKTAIVILIGLLLSFIVFKTSIYDISLFVSFGILLFCMFYILSDKLKDKRLAFEQSIAQSTRLKYELLKKKIQPHFLMNTLTSLIDWVEEAPEKGVEFIEALAEEFDLLNQVENEKLISISQEIKLCKSHINIMKYRKEIDYIWKDEGINESENQRIPPAVIHTLLENGITHCLPLDNNIMQFKLSVKSSVKELNYTFITFGKVRSKTKKNTGGTGFKYIKARLKESYGNQWEFTSNEIENGWKNRITIYK